MIKFFRKIRYNLMEQNKTGKYFKYAIGEIVLVVIGILIALSINNWNENNKSEKEGSFQLSKLRDNLISDKAQLKAAIFSDSLYIDNLTYCVRVLSNEIEAPLEKFLNRFQTMSTIMNFNQTRGAFDGLVSSGKIELINNQILLDALFSYYNSNPYRQWDSSLKDYSRNVFMPYILGFDHIPEPNKEGRQVSITQFDVSKFSVEPKTIDDYKNDLFILNGLRKKIQLLEGQKNVYSELLDDIESLIDSINNELN